MSDLQAMELAGSSMTKVILLSQPTPADIRCRGVFFDSDGETRIRFHQGIDFLINDTLYSLLSSTRLATPAGLSC